MTRQYSDSIALAARRIVAASAVDITEPVAILPLARQLMQETGCGIDAAKRHVTKAIRLARGELTTAPAWGGRRTPAGGRPKMTTPIFPATVYETPDTWGSITVYANEAAMQEQIESLRDIAPDWQEISISDCAQWSYAVLSGSKRAIYEKPGRNYEYGIFERTTDPGYYKLVDSYNSLEEAKANF